MADKSNPEETAECKLGAIVAADAAGHGARAGN
jgi:hypothetical protein